MKSPASPGSISSVLAISSPIIVAQAADTVMVFCDRYFLSQISPHHMSASMMGGMMAFFFVTFFFGITSYVTALVAQYYGAKQFHNCALTTTQAVILSCLAYPLLLQTIPLGCWLFSIIGHAAEQTELESTYFTILSYGSIISLVRVCLSGFFSGIGKTRTVMVTNVIGTVLNIPISYALIFGAWGLPAMGIAGAAIGTLIGGFVTLLLLIFCSFKPEYRETYQVHRAFRYVPEIAKKFIRYGLPSGFEFVLKMGAIVFFFQLFEAYGPVAAAALTITIQWDFVAFLPVIGLHIGVMSLVGRHMGAGEPQLARSTALAGLKIAYIYSGTLCFCFLFLTDSLLSVFLHGKAGGDEIAIRELGLMMLRTAALYTLANTTYQIFSGALKGAGDTRWTMATTMTGYTILALSTGIAIKVFAVPPMAAWLIFVVILIVLGICFTLRFKSGKWQKLSVICENAETS